MGVAGNCKIEDEKMDVFGDEGTFERMDFGLKFAAKANYSNFFLTAWYDLGLINISKSVESLLGDFDFGGVSLDLDIDEPKVKTGNLFVSVGYVF